MKFDHFKRTGMKFDTGMKKGKNTSQHLPTLRPGMEFYNVFITFFTHVYSIYFATLTCLNIIKVKKKDVIGPFYKN